MNDKNEDDQMRDTFSDLNNLESPINILPEEILEKIFSFTSQYKYVFESRYVCLFV